MSDFSSAPADKAADYTHGLPEYVPGSKKTKLLAQTPGVLKERTRASLRRGDTYLIERLRARYGDKPFARGYIDVGRLNRLLGREIVLASAVVNPHSPDTLLRLVATATPPGEVHHGTDWSEVECYFAVWGYDRLDADRSIVKQHLYEEIATLIDRTPQSVAYKIQNVSHFDQRPRTEKPVTTAANAQAKLGIMFKWYWADKDAARSLYSTFLQQLQFGPSSNEEAVKPTPEQTENRLLLIEEGIQTTSTRTVRRRSRALVEKAREHFRKLEPNGKLRCYACSFFASDAIGENNQIIHLHHTKPIYLMGASGQKTTLEEAIAALRPLCPTCHVIAHTRRPPLSVGEIKKIRTG